MLGPGAFAKAGVAWPRVNPGRRVPAAFGRVAEAYGKFDTAMAYYAKVEKPVPGIYLPEDSYDLAQMRLGALKLRAQ